MNRKVRWGILSTAAIGLNKVIPAMQRGDWSEVTAIASRDINTAKESWYERTRSGSGRSS